ncbi:MAG: hypothetical protein JSU70_07415 [Phycisphaerales bacterium]|nr:MAG: hypothetical protein JSU70_07415 [Phycisphaerales bacterium]
MSRLMLNVLLPASILILRVSIVTAGSLSVWVVDEASPRVEFGLNRLTEALKSAKIKYTVVRRQAIVPEHPLIAIGSLGDGSALVPLIPSEVRAGSLPGREGFLLMTCDREVTLVAGGDDSGTLYGCLELAARIRALGAIPKDLKILDEPVFRLRGPCIGMQKTYELPDRGQYNYPYTPELFPFFYDEQQWLEFLDLLLENRMNTLYLWNGHPFSSLVRLPDYPEAVEVPEEVFRRNQQVFRFLTTEADKRGIWVIQMFYNIHFPKTLAQKYGVGTHHAEPTELNSDYTRKSISAFVESYPNVGLLVCLGEALSGDDNKRYWLTEVIIPGVQDGMRALGLKREPPIIVRQHTMDGSAREIIGAGLQKYQNLYTMMKYNGEALTTCQPRGPWAQIHRDLSSITSQHISNVHILANLEPFRYGATRFIQKCAKAAQTIHHANGVHLYPLAYWAWPDSPDKAEMKQFQRDWIWFAAWARYAWDPDRKVEAEDTYWISRLTEFYGSKAAAMHILEAYNHAGLCAPMLLRRFGITNGNRQTLSLGMTLDQLVDPRKYRLWPRLVDSDGPVGERLDTYVERQWKGQEHEGETPLDVIREVLRHSRRAVKEINLAQDHVSKSREEFLRLRNDMLCIRAMSEHYAAKAQAAMSVLRYRFSQDVKDLQKAFDFLTESVEQYRVLAHLTKDSYSYANSLQTGARKIPFGGSGGAFKHWTECLPAYERELSDFRRDLEKLMTAEVQVEAARR